MTNEKKKRTEATKLNFYSYSFGKKLILVIEQINLFMNFIPTEEWTYNWIGDRTVANEQMYRNNRIELLLFLFLFARN